MRERQGVREGDGGEKWGRGDEGEGVREGNGGEKRSERGEWKREEE